MITKCNYHSREFNEKVIIANEMLSSDSVHYYSIGTNNYFPLLSEDSILKVDWIPKVITYKEWDILKKGVTQRFQAMNLFMKDVYKGNQTIVPEEIIKSSKFYSEINRNLQFNYDIYSHIYGIDLVQNEDGEYIVLEDNLGMPGGIGYIQKIREISNDVFKKLYQSSPVEIESYSKVIESSLKSLSMSANKEPVIVYIQRGPGASGSYEYQQLIKDTDIILAGPEDVELIDNRLYLKTVNNDLVRIDVVYFRLFSERFSEFHEKLAVAINHGLTCVTYIGNILANDKAIFSYIPELIQYYLHETPILKQPRTIWLGANKKKNPLNEKNTVIKSRWGAGGKEVFIGHELTEKKLKDLNSIIKKNPVNFIKQDLVNIKKDIYYNIANKQIEKGYSDLRLFAVMNSNYSCEVMPGGVSRVSFGGSMKVNVGSGGAMKDVWLMRR